MNCPDIEALERLAMGGALDDTAGGIKRHLASCQKCRVLAADTAANLVIAAAVQKALTDSDASSRPIDTPKTIGPYRIVREIGRGGMGIVYEAEQHHTQRIVALKVIRAGYASSESLRRFEHESRVLARLEHPGIARIYEAGTADTGRGPQPYFAME